jgi:energy-coupling factor transporter ATP-binding protein EcfA2
LIHEQNRAGIMVTHDLRMCRYVDKIVQMMDGQISRIIIDRREIEQLVGAAELADGHAPLSPPAGQPENEEKEAVLAGI